MSPVLVRRALQLHQHDAIPLYLFTLAAAEVDAVADVSRISRDEAGRLIGYQRPEKQDHVRQIREYLDSEGALFPNSLILALPESVRFRASRGPGNDDGLATAGVLEIPFVTDEGVARPAFIVDGQQRSLALARTSRTHMPIPVAGFVAEDLVIQRDQFLRVNTVKPLPVNLVTELLPEVFGAPSPRLSARKLPSALVDMLNQDPQSPFHQLIRRPSSDSKADKRPAVTDNSLVESFKESLGSPSGVMFPYRNLTTGSTDTDGIKTLLLTYWSAVRDTFPEAWGRPATESRLMHGVGIRSMGRLMERVMAQVNLYGPDPLKQTREELERIAPLCRWTAGTWPELGLAWNELQNTPRHISGLSNFLVRSYLDARTGA